MDTEEKKNTRSPGARSRKRRKKAPQAAQGGAASSGVAADAGLAGAAPADPPKSPETEHVPESSGAQALPRDKTKETDAAQAADTAAAAPATGHAPLPEEREDPLPDGVAVSEVELSDALDKMMQEDPAPQAEQSQGGEEPPADDAAGEKPASAAERPAEDAVGDTEEEPAPAAEGTAGEESTAEDTAEAESDSAEVSPPEENSPVKETTVDGAAEEEPGPDEAEGEPAGEGSPAKEMPADDAAPEEPAEENEDEKRLSDLTRTVQLSVEQIMSQVESEPADGAGPQEEEPEDAVPATLRDHLRSGLSGMCKWLLLVVFFVLVIAGGGVAWLYRSATPDMVPNITVSFAGQTVQPAAYKWKVPVVGNLFKRTYAETLSSVPVALESPVEQSSPDVQISPSDYRAEITVTGSADNVLFEGSVEDFASYRFAANGQYTAKLVVYIDQSAVSGAADVSGSETWLFDFTLGVRASIHLNSETVDQGGVAAIRVGSTLDGRPPVIDTELENAGFVPAGTGWVCYLPIAWNQAARDYEINVTAGGHTETLSLKVRATEWEYKDYSQESQRAEPYINDANMPAEVKKLLADSDDTIAWTNSNFVQPFLSSLDIKLAYGTTEYVGRSYSERGSNTGAGGRTAVNTILNTTRGELLIAPASGTVQLAKDLGGDYGNTLVIDHGAGVKSIFYGLRELEVKTGDLLKQGQTLATCNNTTVAELRIGNVPVDPLPVWRGQCDALKYY